MHKSIITSLIIILLQSCEASSTVTTKSDPDQKDDVAIIVQAAADLPDCSSDSKDELFYIISLEVFLICNGNEYETIDLNDINDTVVSENDFCHYEASGYCTTLDPALGDASEFTCEGSNGIYYINGCPKINALGTCRVNNLDQTYYLGFSYADICEAFTSCEIAAGVGAWIDGADSDSSDC